MRRLQFICGVLLLLLCLPASAQSVVDSLCIYVDLKDNGAADVTENWHIDVAGNITEWYLVEDNLGRMTVGNLSVRDESGSEYVNEGDWNVDRSREAKARRCGIVRKGNGCEICWGVGSNGPHVYSVSYELTGLVKAYSDADGFNHMFVARGLGSSPKCIILTVRKKGLVLTSENVQVWGFGYNGEVNVLDGAVRAWTTESFTPRSAMIVMCRFGKGIFNPELSVGRSFEDVKAAAFEGSDYHEEKDGSPGFMSIVYTALVVLFGGIFVFSSISAARRKRKRKAELLGGVSLKEVPWFRDVPVDGDLHAAYSILKNMDAGVQDLEHLIGAYITRLYYKGAFSIVPQDIGKPAFKINPDYKGSGEQTPDQVLENRMYCFFKVAAGSDEILQQKELKRWANSHGEELYKWQKDVPDGKNIWTLQPSDVQQVFGLRRFLKDFTLIKDRGVVEVGLWNNYLIFASLFGMAEQVYKDFKKVCPEYFTLAQSVVKDVDVAPVVLWDTIGSTSRYMNNSAVNYASGMSSESTRWSGGGGHASFGGGGGFSGGGTGGGGR